MKLNYEKKRFLNCIKMFTCNIKGKMCKLLSNCCRRKNEILPALSMIVERGGHVKLQEGQLKVRLKRKTATKARERQ